MLRLFKYLFVLTLVVSCKTNSTKAKNKPNTFIAQVLNSLQAVEAAENNGSIDFTGSTKSKEEVEELFITLDKELDKAIKEVEDLPKPAKDFKIKKNTIFILYDTKFALKNISLTYTELIDFEKTDGSDLKKIGAIMRKTLFYASKFVEISKATDRLNTDIIAYHKFYKIELPEKLKLIDNELEAKEYDVKKFTIPEDDLKAFYAQKNRFEVKDGYGSYNGQEIKGKIDIEHIETILGTDYTLEKKDNISRLHYNNIPVTAIFNQNNLLYGCTINLKDNLNKPFFILVEGYPFSRPTKDFGKIIGIYTTKKPGHIIDIHTSNEIENIIMYTDVNNLTQQGFTFHKTSKGIEATIYP
ncbi:hypothetical protein M4I21_12445 [Cellulophaga sp. 20_2_10]|uniref:hypothetical protein n=1 Tax=Cellulophaga sp. 20_2_10 TaxID=2942476 RepID=UPI00201AE26A|nr:hypothetical protein [Cellulophaga sp. 20_2_10]MCL5246626.1 hypothetical protein [Cellulophaga sp. 20_2_10]